MQSSSEHGEMFWLSFRCAAFTALSPQSRFAKVLAKLEFRDEAERTTGPPGDEAEAQSTSPTPPALTTIIMFRCIKAKQSNVAIDGSSDGIVTGLWTG